MRLSWRTARAVSPFEVIRRGDALCVPREASRRSLLCVPREATPARPALCAPRGDPGAAIRDFSGNAAGEFPARRPGCVPCKAAFGVAIGPCAAYEAAFGVVTWRNTACEATFSAVTCSLPCEAIPGIPARAAHPREASRRGDALCVPREVTLSAAARLGRPDMPPKGAERAPGRPASPGRAPCSAAVFSPIFRPHRPP